MTLLPDVTMSDQGDILYLTLRETSIVKTREYGDERLLDFDRDGQLVGAEFIGVASYVDLRGLPSLTVFRTPSLRQTLRVLIYSSNPLRWPIELVRFLPSVR